MRTLYEQVKVIRSTFKSNFNKDLNTMGLQITLIFIGTVFGPFELTLTHVFDISNDIVSPLWGGSQTLHLSAATKQQCSSYVLGERACTSLFWFPCNASLYILHTCTQIILLIALLLFDAIVLYIILDLFCLAEKFWNPIFKPKNYRK